MNRMIISTLLQYVWYPIKGGIQFIRIQPNEIGPNFWPANVYVFELSEAIQIKLNLIKPFMCDLCFDLPGSLFKNPYQSNPIQSDPIRPDPTRPDPTRPDSIRFDSKFHTNPIRFNPTRFDPTRPDPIRFSWNNSLTLHVFQKWRSGVCACLRAKKVS